MFVGDVTPIATSAKGKAAANLNVLIELGYAKKSISLTRVLLIWNTAFPGATIEQLPFDMRGRRAPIGFHLSSGASKANLAAAREQLRRVLVDALRASLAVAVPATPVASPEWQASWPADPGIWFDPSRPLAINEDGQPGSKSATWTLPSTFGQGQRDHPHILGMTNGFSGGATKGGYLHYSGSLRSSRISLATSRSRGRTAATMRLAPTLHYARMPIVSVRGHDVMSRRAGGCPADEKHPRALASCRRLAQARYDRGR